MNNAEIEKRRIEESRDARAVFASNAAKKPRVTLLPRAPFVPHKRDQTTRG